MEIIAPLVRITKEYSLDGYLIMDFCRKEAGEDLGDTTVSSYLQWLGYDKIRKNGKNQNGRSFWNIQIIDSTKQTGEGNGGDT